jgi:hypothetical protein
MLAKPWPNCATAKPSSCQAGVDGRRVPPIDRDFLDAVALAELGDVLDDCGVIHHVALGELQKAGVTPAQIVGAVALGLPGKAGLGQKETGEHVIAHAVAPIVGEHRHNGRRSIPVT